MKTLKYIISSIAVVAALSSCFKDLDVTPIDRIWLLPTRP